MRPGQIRVFDGLRITAEHIEHFQGSLHSAIHDLRELAGAGRVHRGLEVEPGEMASVTVRPGIAFDRRRNRVVCDDPVTLSVDFDDGAAPRYVCIRYAPVEDGVVEGRATMLWDSCELFITAEPPAADDDAIVLARVHPAAAGALEVHRVTRDDVAPPDAADAPRLRILQGIARLGAADVATDVAALPADAATALLDLIRDAHAGPDATAALPIALELGSSEVATPFAVDGLTTLVRLQLRLEAESDATEGEPRPRVAWEAVGHAHGEANFTAPAVAAHALSHTGAGWSALDIDLLARLPMAAAVDDMPAALRRLCTTVELHISATPRPGGFALGAHLHWSDTADADLIDDVASRHPALEWTADIAWKAMGTGGATAQEGR